MPRVRNDYGNVHKNKVILQEGDQIAILVSVISYFTLVGWLVAIVINDKHQSTLASFHLRQSLGLIITGAILALIPLVGWVLTIAVVVMWLIALLSAIQGQVYKVPFLGNFYQQHLDFIE